MSRLNTRLRRRLTGRSSHAPPPHTHLRGAMVTVWIRVRGRGRVSFSIKVRCWINVSVRVAAMVKMSSRPSHSLFKSLVVLSAP